MRIGIDVRALEAKHITGVDSYLRSLLRSFAMLDNGHTFVLFGTRGLDRLPEVRVLLERGHQFVLQTWPSRVFNFCMRFLGRPMLDKLMGGLDVIFYPNPMFHAASDSVKKVITFHDLSFERLKPVYSLKRNLWHEIVDPRSEALAADKILAVSESTKKDLHNIYGVEESKIEVIPLGVDSQLFEGDQAGSLSLPDKYILFMGSLEPRKNVSTLLAAHARLLNKYPDLHLVLAGSFFPQRDNQALRTALESRNVVLTGPVSELDKVGLYRQARMVVLPSLYEGFGLQVVESLAAGTPLIVSAGSSLPQTAQGAALLVNPFNINELANAIEKLLINDDLRNNLISRGREVAKQYTWQETARQTLNALETV